MNRPQPVPEPRTLSLSNVEAEAALLGALMGDNGKVDVIADLLCAEDFAEPLHGDIYQAILDLTANGQQADPHTLRPAFANDPRMISLGGAAYLVTLTDGMLYMLAVKDTAAQIADLAARRRLIRAMASVQASVIEPDITIAGIVDEADAALVAAVERREATPQISAGDGMQAVLARIEAIQRGEGPAGIVTGINDIDALLGGFEPGQLVILAGRPGMGKTAVAGSIATGCAKAGAGTLFISLEMSTGELSARMLADAAFNGTRGIDFGRIIGATVSGDEMRELARLTADLADLPLMIVDVGSMTISRLALGIRRHKRRFAARGHDLKLVVIDYLQLLRTDEKHRSVYEAVSEISRALKGLAKDCGVTILALAQLNRGVEGRDDKRPGLSDIRDSGQIEQDADAVLFLHREEYYLARNKPKKADQLDAWEQACSDAAGRIDFILAKRRNGPAGLSRRGYFFSHYQAVRGSDLYGDRP